MPDCVKANWTVKHTYGNEGKPPNFPVPGNEWNSPANDFDGDISLQKVSFTLQTLLNK